MEMERRAILKIKIKMKIKIKTICEMESESASGRRKKRTPEMVQRGIGGPGLKGIRKIR